jgi:hypothetical protein
MLRHLRDQLQSEEYRENDRQARAEFGQFCYQHGGLALRHDLLPRGAKPKTALFVTISYLPLARLEGFVIKALQLAGFETVVLGNRRHDFLRYYRLAGAKSVLDWSDFSATGDPEWVEHELSRLGSIREWLALEYRGVHVGRFAMASAMRSLKRGQFDFANPGVREELRPYLESTVRYTLAGIGVLDQIKPDCAMFLDPGYISQGELFDLALQRGIDALRWQAAHKSNFLLFKRYHSGNQRDHHFSLSAESWRRISALPWKPEFGQEIRKELFDCYQSQDWFSQVGTQFGKKILSSQVTRQKLGLSSGKKVAVIFPHISWDGSFFAGEDLFGDYTEWFIQTIRAACANPRLDWVVKIHPAHAVKAKREKIPGRPHELDVIEQALGSLPAHVKLVHPETELSTYSLFEVADYAVTVRGTVGIEAALFGIPVVTAGTGRYDRRGFTLDSATCEEYLKRLATLETQPRLSAEEVELAERFAYGVFCMRPLRLSSISVGYERDAVATQKVAIHCRTQEEWVASQDMQRLAGWIADGKAEDLLTWPQESQEGREVSTSESPL